MAHFKEGTKVTISNGTSYKIEMLELIGSGNQADIYKAKNKETNEFVAAKHCYYRFANDKVNFYKKVFELSKTPAPHPDLCWPQGVSKLAADKSFVYTMPLVGSEYKSLSGVIKNKDGLTVKQKVILLKKAALILDALHTKGYVFGDISHNNILYKIDKNGDVYVKFIDCENISNRNEFFGMMGSEKYQPPEMLIPDFKGNYATPTKESDIFAFQVLAFRVLIRRHPLDGEQARSRRADDNTAYKQFYGMCPRFIFDGTENSPNKTIETRWEALPYPMQVFFKNAFSQSCLLNKNSRSDMKTFLKMLEISYNI